MRAFYHFLGCGRRMNPSWFESLDQLSKENCVNLPEQAVSPCPEQSVLEETESDVVEAKKVQFNVPETDRDVSSDVDDE